MRGTFLKIWAGGISAVVGFGDAIAQTAQKAMIVTNAPAQSTNQLGTDIRPIKEAIPLPDYILWALIILAVLVAAIAGYFLWRWLKLRANAAPTTLLIPPHRRAIERLRGALALIDDPQPFCTEVSNIERLYLEERFMLHAPERTTEEFLGELQGAQVLNANQKAALGTFLGQCDLVKFARHEPTRPELEELYKTALRLVEETAVDADAVRAPGATVEAGAS